MTDYQGEEQVVASAQLQGDVEPPTPNSSEHAPAVQQKEQGPEDEKKQTSDGKKRPRFALLMLLQASAALTQGASTNNFSSDIIKMLYMRIYGYSFEVADIQIQSLLNWLSVAILIGSMVAAFTLSLATRYVGYKLAAFIGTIGCTVFNALQCIPVNPYYVLAMRLISGYFQTTFTSITLIIVGEYVEDNRRGTIGICFQLFVCVGMLWSGLILLLVRAVLNKNNINLYYISFIAALIFSIAGTIVYFFIPDIQEKKSKGDKKELEITFLQIFKRMYLRVLFLAIFLGLLQQLTGINSVIVYATETFKQTFKNDPLSSVYGNLIIAGVNLIGTLAALPVIERWGRQVLLFLGTALCIVGVAMMVANYTIKQEIPALLIAASVIFIFGFEIGPGSVFFAYAGELFPVEAKGVLSSVLQVFNFMPNFLVILLFTYLTKVAKYVPFLTYLIGMIICLVVLIFISIETKGKTREQIDNELLGRKQDTEAVVQQGEQVLVQQ